jgi:hypothetical protein
MINLEEFSFAVMDQVWLKERDSQASTEASAFQKKRVHFISKP